MEAMNNKKPAPTEAGTGKGEREDSGKLTFNLYRVNSELSNLIETSVDPETGEISEEAWALIEQLTTKRTALVQDIGLYYKQLGYFTDACDQEIEAVKKRKQQAVNIQERIKRLLVRALNGEKLSTPNLTVTFRTSETVETDPVFEIEELEKTNPDLVRVKVVKELDKVKIKELAKQGILPAGITIMKKTGVTVK